MTSKMAPRAPRFDIDIEFDIPDVDQGTTVVSWSHQSITFTITNVKTPKPQHDMVLQNLL